MSTKDFRSAISFQRTQSDTRRGRQARGLRSRDSPRISQSRGRPDSHARGFRKADARCLVAETSLESVERDCHVIVTAKLSARMPPAARTLLAYQMPALFGDLNSSATKGYFIKW
ncbi:hypothetical protein NDU88_001416 [Pleurodeles waltl]|uniref:Uncharacterized protein n=1 Tax=Pleurodeles waltl TaxID=8319 RepID=A0AAV7MUL8_PLEWA|nr:hypothetical protein NDU88_001416 [Pleurodeles waltl]